jgi:DNA uptake protein ComE-like DNA-binding protein
MKRILWVFALAALMFSVGTVALALRSSHWALGGPGSAVADTSATKEAPATEKAEEKESPAEEKKETPAQEKAEEKSEAKTHHAKAAPKIDINSASKEGLMKLPGITDEIAEKIIAGRPFTSTSELHSKNILTSAENNKIKAKVVATKPKATTK